MKRLFPRALVACIKEGRSPDSEEVTDLAAKIMREAFGQRHNLSTQSAAKRLARVAFSGDRSRLRALA
jgi:hypothetical protein